ncbi:M56 family metallopeptidase [Algoriphagus antarcticus]|uniref:Beta-lactamase regulating signal transducer with metallopeptidase domain n=1 Tax=Algoriphagus antarcticus TaxID=238540 RepID=A0A3E0DFA4_9BACT|nr:M56 family metallopeptidase [Algoriphagus antarcticus]REG81253.1 beta-lactamase regulating signal transducer with metallopeptidase domain [Algoriphagus antarcticus]
MVYLLKSIACLLILLFVHRLLLQREAMHRFNRFFLLFSVVASFLIPLYTIEVHHEIAEPIELVSEPIFFESSSESLSEDLPVFVAVEKTQFNWENLFIGIYILISMIFLFRFVRNIKILVNQIQRNVKIIYRDQTLVLLKGDSLPYSFLKYIFVAESHLENGKFTDAVFDHERTHIEEKHSWDILFIEGLLVPLWFHPGLYWAKATIKLNHEFIADAAALRSTSLEKYESQLLAMMLSGQKYGLASSLNFSLTKKRFEMMKRKSRSSNSWIKVLVLLPVLGMLVYFFSERVTAEADSDPAMPEVYVNASNTIYDDDIDYDLTLELKPNGAIFLENQEYGIDALKEMILMKKAAKDDLKINLITSSRSSMGELSDFQEMLRELDIRRINYVSYDQNPVGSGVEQNAEKETYYRNASFFVENEAGELIAKTYNELSESVKTSLTPPLKAPAKRKPSGEEFESWKNSADFALWLDGKVIPNSQLENMSTSDIVYVFSSFVHLNARSERFPQEYQVSLYSHEAYERTYGNKSDFGAPMTKDHKLYIYPAAKRVNHGKPWIKKGNEPVAKQQTSDSSKWPPTIKADRIKDLLQSYVDANLAYEKLRNQAPHFVERTKAEQEKLTEMFSDLGSKYYQVAFNDKPKVERPIHPFAPYLKLKSKGRVYYKLKEDLTAEEVSQLPTPPPMANPKKK